jgi:peptidoglycan-N-acetylglucosamine deacetylase
MNILTFDIEDWFHINFDPSFTTDENYRSFEGRLEAKLFDILDILEERNIEATFLCLGWIAKVYPHLIREIDKRGHEIGSHTFLHKLVHNQTPSEFDKDLSKSIKTLSDVTGKPIRIFRAPAFSIGPKNPWAFEVLIQNGIEIDLSVFPASRDFGGYQDIKTNSPHWIQYNGLKIKEYPINTGSFFKQKIIYSGGGYFRMLPFFLTQNLFQRNGYNMAYFHARDFDPKQPILDDLSFVRKLKSYYGLKSCWRKFEALLDNNDFISLRQSEQTYNWNTAKTICIDANAI